MPPAFEMDVSAYYELQFGTLRPRVFVEIYNLFDARSVQNVFSDTGKPDVTLDQLRTGQFDPGYFVRPGHYSEPRRIQLGVDFRF